MSEAKRKVATILAADVVGFSRLMEADEPKTVKILQERRELFSRIVSGYDGREFGSAGDSLMAEVPSAVNAISCAVAIQKAFSRANANLPEAERMTLRIGVNLGDLIEQDGLLYGDGVNIAARLQELAPTGGICVSSAVYEQVRSKTDVKFEYVGDRKVKNISTPLKTYHIVGLGESMPFAGAVTPRFKSRTAGLIVSLVFITGVLWTFKIYIGGDQSTSSADPTVTVKSRLPDFVDPRSIAVLPFRNISASEEEADFLANGLHEELLTVLTRIGQLKVISRTSMMHYQNSNKTIPVISSELKVANIVEGSLQRFGNGIRINVQLVDASSDRHLWAQSFSSELSTASIFETQAKIATEIANSLDATLTPGEEKRITSIPTDNFSAYKAYLLGKQRLALRTSQSISEATKYFEEAISIDPEFALAYTGLADCYALQTYYSGSSREVMNSRAEQLIKKALELDDSLGEAHTSLASLQHSRFDFIAAEKSFKHALTLNQNYATTYQWYGSLLVDMRRGEDALEQFNRALQLDPLSLIVNTNIAQTYELLGRFSDALVQTDRILEIDANSSLAYWARAQIYWTALPGLDEAYKLYRKSLALAPDHDTNAMLGLLNLDLGDVEEAQCLIRRGINAGPESFYTNYAMQHLYIARDNVDLAAESAERVLDALPVWWRPLMPVAEVTAGDFQEAYDWYRDRFLELAHETDPDVRPVNSGAAIDLAFILQKLGHKQGAEILLDRAEALHAELPRLGFYGYWVDDARIYVLRGKHDQALLALRQGISEGWRHTWWYFFDHDPVLAPLHDNQEFQDMRRELSVEINNQLTRVRATPLAGSSCLGESTTTVAGIIRSK